MGRVVQGKGQPADHEGNRRFFGMFKIVNEQKKDKIKQKSMGPLLGVTDAKWSLLKI